MMICFVDTMTERHILLMTYSLRQRNNNIFCRHNDRETYSFNDILRQKTGEHKTIVIYYMWKGNQIHQRRMICH